MSFTFNNAIPAAGNNPSNDQPDMLTNNISTQALIGVDHNTFNTLNGGWHNIIHFNTQVTDPAVVTGTGQQYSKTVGSDVQLFYQSGVNQGSGFGVITQLTGAKNPSVTANGYVYLAGGVLLQWGNFIATTANPITFATPFPNACFQVIGSTSANDRPLAIVTISTASFTFSVNNPTGAITCRWMAIGN